MVINTMGNEALSDILVNTDITETIDIGCAFINVGKHPELGDIVGISGISDLSALIQLSK